MFCVYPDNLRKQTCDVVRFILCTQRGFQSYAAIVFSSCLCKPPMVTCVLTPLGLRAGLDALEKWRYIDIHISWPLTVSISHPIYSYAVAWYAYFPPADMPCAATLITPLLSHRIVVTIKYQDCAFRLQPLLYSRPRVFRSVTTGRELIPDKGVSRYKGNVAPVCCLSCASCSFYLCLWRFRGVNSWYDCFIGHVVSINGLDATMIVLSV